MAVSPLVGIIMGSKSDLPILQNTCDTLTTLGVPFEIRVVSAHRTPEAAIEYAKTAESRGLKVIIAAAGGAAHLPGVAAALTALPVIGIPIESASLKGLDSLLSIVQMPAGVPVATVAIGKPGAINAAILASQIIATANPGVAKALKEYRAAATQKILAEKIELPAKA